MSVPIYSHAASFRCDKRLLNGPRVTTSFELFFCFHVLLPSPATEHQYNANAALHILTTLIDIFLISKAILFISQILHFVHYAVIDQS